MTSRVPKPDRPSYIPEMHQSPSTIENVPSKGGLLPSSIRKFLTFLWNFTYGKIPANFSDLKSKKEKLKKLDALLTQTLAKDPLKMEGFKTIFAVKNEEELQAIHERYLPFLIHLDIKKVPIILNIFIKEGQVPSDWQKARTDLQHLSLNDRSLFLSIFAEEVIHEPKLPVVLEILEKVKYFENLSFDKKRVFTKALCDLNLEKLKQIKDYSTKEVMKFFNTAGKL